MHAKIVLLPGSPVGERLCGIAEEVLTDVSVAFGHTFSIVRDKIGEAAMRAYGVPLSENTLRLCGQANAVFIGDADNEAEPFLLRALGIPAKSREFSVGGAENARFMITRAVTETMVNGNLGEAFNRVRGISRELCCDGSSVVPYIAVDGIVISGK